MPQQSPSKTIKNFYTKGLHPHFRKNFSFLSSVLILLIEPLEWLFIGLVSHNLDHTSCLSNSSSLKSIRDILQAILCNTQIVWVLVMGLTAMNICLLLFLLIQLVQYTNKEGCSQKKSNNQNDSSLQMKLALQINRIFKACCQSILSVYNRTLLIPLLYFSLFIIKNESKGFLNLILTLGIGLVSVDCDFNYTLRLGCVNYLSKPYLPQQPILFIVRVFAAISSICFPTNALLFISILYCIKLITFSSFWYFYYEFMNQTFLLLCSSAAISSILFYIGFIVPSIDNSFLLMIGIISIPLVGRLCYNLEKQNIEQIAIQLSEDPSQVSSRQLDRFARMNFFETKSISKFGFRQIIGLSLQLEQQTISQPDEDFLKSDVQLSSSINVFLINILSSYDFLKKQNSTSVSFILLTLLIRQNMLVRFLIEWDKIFRSQLTIKEKQILFTIFTMFEDSKNMSALSNKKLEDPFSSEFTDVIYFQESIAQIKTDLNTSLNQKLKLLSILSEKSIDSQDLVDSLSKMYISQQQLLQKFKAAVRINSRDADLIYFQYIFENHIAFSPQDITGPKKFNSQFQANSDIVPRFIDQKCVIIASQSTQKNQLKDWNITKVTSNFSSIFQFTISESVNQSITNLLPSFMADSHYKYIEDVLSLDQKSLSEKLSNANRLIYALTPLGYLQPAIMNIKINHSQEGTTNLVAELMAIKSTYQTILFSLESRIIYGITKQLRGVLFRQSSRQNLIDEILPEFNFFEVLNQNTRAIPQEQSYMIVKKKRGFNSFDFNAKRSEIDSYEFILLTFSLKEINYKYHKQIEINSALKQKEAHYQSVLSISVYSMILAATIPQVYEPEKKLEPQSAESLAGIYPSDLNINPSSSVDNQTRSQLKFNSQGDGSKRRSTFEELGQVQVKVTLKKNENRIEEEIKLLTETGHLLQQQPLSTNRSSKYFLGGNEEEKLTDCISYTPLRSDRAKIGILSIQNEMSSNLISIQSPGTVIPTLNQQVMNDYHTRRSSISTTTQIHSAHNQLYSSQQRTSQDVVDMQFQQKFFFESVRKHQLSMNNFQSQVKIHEKDKIKNNYASSELIEELTLKTHQQTFKNEAQVQQYSQSSRSQEQPQKALKRAVASLVKSQRKEKLISIMNLFGISSYLIILGLSITQYSLTLSTINSNLDEWQIFDLPSVYQENIFNMITYMNIANFVNRTDSNYFFDILPEKRVSLTSDVAASGKIIKQTLTDMLASFSRLGTSRRVIDLILSTQTQFIMGKYYPGDPAGQASTIVGVNGVNVSSNLLMTMQHGSFSIFRYTTFFQSKGRQEYYILQNQVVISSLLRSIYSQLQQEKINEKEDIDQVLLFTMLVVVILSFICIISILPIYSYVQSLRDDILFLFGTFSFTQLEQQKNDIIQILNHSSTRQQKGKNRFDIGSNKSNIKINNPSNSQVSNRHSISTVTRLPKSRPLMILAIFIIIIAIASSPIYNKIDTSNYFKQVIDDYQVSYTIHKTKAHILELMGINYFNLSLKLYPSSKPMKLSAFLHQSQRVISDGPQTKDDIKNLIQSQHQYERYEQVQYDQQFFPILETSIYDTILENSLFKSKETESIAKKCSNIDSISSFQGINAGYSKYLSIMEELYIFMAETDQTKSDQILQQLKKSLDIYDFSMFSQCLCEGINSLGFFIQQTHTKHYNSIIETQLILLILQISLLSLIFLIGWTQLGFYLSKQIFSTISFLQVINIIDLLENSYIISYVKNNRQS